MSTFIWLSVDIHLIAKWPWDEEHLAMKKSHGKGSIPYMAVSFVLRERPSPNDLKRC